ncbi:MAG: flagellar hook-length control protein FliK [Treponema sp.]|nr:flagellar hook-length control protein FliK [Treponema sp.]
MITISAYTELVPVSIAVNEPQPYEPEEDDREGFAELLAGLLQKAEMNVTPDVPLAGSSDIDDASEEADTGKKLDLFGKPEGMPDGIEKDISYIETSQAIFSEAELSETDLSEERMGVLLSAEHLSGDSLGTVVFDADTANNLLSEISNVKTESHPPETRLQPKTDYSETDFSQIASANVSANAEESLSAQSGKRKDTQVKEPEENALFKDGNIKAIGEKEMQNKESAILHNKPEKESLSRQDDMRGRTRRDKVTLEVRDLRTEAGTGRTNNAQARAYASVEASAGRVNSEAPVQEMTLELRLPDHAQNAAQTTWEVKAGNALENMLARELHQNFNGDIVRHASMALRDGGEGTIRIALKPESLGNVKIHLEMTENKITGRIVVDSEEALNAFRREISFLEQAFRDSGFANADLNLSLTSDGQNTEGWEQEGFFTQQMAASRYEDSFSHEALSVVDVYFERKLGSVNLFA